MLISKFDLYKREWLDLVFADRNRNYGAYDLRSHYGDNMLKALAIAVVGITASAIVLTMVLDHKTADNPPLVVTTYDAKQIVIEPDKPREAIKQQVKHVAPKPASAPKVVSVPTTAFKPPVVTNDPVTTQPPTIAELQRTAVGPETIKGTGVGINTSPGQGVGGTGTGPGPGSGDITTNEPMDMGGVDVLPEPFGGAAAWTKFLQKNVRYPDTEQQGRVLLSFIIEKDGHLSDIKVIRGVSPELDEEAVRVLKIAPAWKPGQQNGKPVRVKYTIPIVFALNQ